MKLLLYCTKAKPNIVKGVDNNVYISNAWKSEGIDDYKLNGKIVAECDFEVEKINYFDDDFGEGERYTKTLNIEELVNKSCLCIGDLYEYLENKYNQFEGYAIHIKNLHIFDKPKELNSYHSQGQVDWIEETELWRLKNGITAPQNMCYAYNYSYSKSELEKFVLISIKPEWLCKILNGEKIIEVRKKVLKEMLK